MGFKEAIQEYGKEITASFSCGGVTYTDDIIISMNPHFEGSLLRSVMKCLDIELKRTSNGSSSTAVTGIAVVGEAIVGIRDTNEQSIIRTPRFGVRAGSDDEYSYIEYGTYIVKEKEFDEEQDTILLECYDLMLSSMVPYNLSVQYPITVKEYLDAICSHMGWSKRYSSFVNSEQVIEEEKYDESYTYRDVLDEIAQVAGGMIAFVGDELDVIYPTNSGETIDSTNLKTLKMGKMYGPVNAVVLSRAPQEDNIYRRNEEDISSNGLTELRIENNQIMDSHREDFIDGIFGVLSGLQFELYEFESFGIGYLKLGDFFTIQTPDGSDHKVLMLSDDLKITQGVSETSKLEVPEATETDYKAASTTDKVLNQTILKVDKQSQEIAAWVRTTATVMSAVDGLEQRVTKLTEISVDNDSVDIKISKAIGDIDSITTSTGYTFNQDGLRIKKSGEEMENLLDNTGMYVKRGNDNILTANNEGVNAINLRSRQFLIVGENSRFEDYSDGTSKNRTACFYIGW